MSKAMDVILARRFSPFDFSVVPGYPNPVPHVDEWQGRLPKFKEGTDDNPAEHLLEFHELMHQLNISHEDVLMNMFMYSLEGDARDWYRSLPLSSISSLQEFHTVFHDHCKSFIQLSCFLNTVVKSLNPIFNFQFILLIVRIKEMFLLRRWRRNHMNPSLVLQS
jgi:hypothetical protein